MPKNEVAWQRDILKQIKAEGGHGKKWATPYTVGVPDLVISVPGVGLALVEVKLETGWDKNTERTLALTEKQSHELNEFRGAGALVAVLLAAEAHRDFYMSLLPAPQRRAKMAVSRAAVLEGSYFWEQRKKRTGFNKWLTGELSRVKKIG